MAELELMDFFKIMIMVQLFYAFAMTGAAYVMPDGTFYQLERWSQITDEISLQGTSEQIQNSMESQTQIPVIDAGALVFYSGNILLDLLLNFAFAVPQMFGMLITGITILLPGINAGLSTVVQLFVSVAFIVLYFLGLMQLIMGIRSGGRVA